MSCSVRGGGGWSSGAKDHSSASSVSPTSCSASVARALAIVASIFARLRTMPASAMSRSTSASPKPATTAGSNPANAARKFSRLRRIVIQARPD
jgi:hypothetical protein